MSNHLIVMAGGTGGHIYPGLAVARAMRTRGWRVSWMGTPNGMEQKLVDASEFPMKSIAFEGIVGRGIGAKFRLPVLLWRAVHEAKRFFVANRPDAVIGMGGYPTVPGGIAASRLGVPLLIHQSDAVAGLANRMLSKFAARVLTGFDSTFNNLQAKRVVTGNPIREEVVAQLPPSIRFANRTGALKLLVMGGSRGADALNRIIPEALSKIDPSARPEVLHQAGAASAEDTAKRYREFGVTADVRDFLSDAWNALAAADLFIGRSGASTVSELASIGVASILVPYPHHKDQQQLHNARVLEAVDAAIIAPQTTMTAESLAAQIKSLSREKLQAMAVAATRVAVPDATKRICDAIEAVANTRARITSAEARA
jgi:UDP-N-acetylglucosamine--N-acetylmuramyl-(pentapeptide) pyrophosphoryl-undecaprenol N-acetylglucosamine transferase